MFRPWINKERTVDRTCTMRHTAHLPLVASVVLLVASFVSVAALGEEPAFQIPVGVPALHPPMLAVACWQSTGSLMIKVVCEGLGVEDDLGTPLPRLMEEAGSLRLLPEG